MPTVKQKEINLKNKMYENVGNWVSQLPTKVQVKKELENKPIKYILK
jgi:hypothetical protein